MIGPGELEKMFREKMADLWKIPEGPDVEEKSPTEPQPVPKTESVLDTVEISGMVGQTLILRWYAFSELPGTLEEVYLDRMSGVMKRRSGSKTYRISGYVPNKTVLKVFAGRQGDASYGTLYFRADQAAPVVITRHPEDPRFFLQGRFRLLDGIDLRSNRTRSGLCITLDPA